MKFNTRNIPAWNIENLYKTYNLGCQEAFCGVYGTHFYVCSLCSLCIMIAKCITLNDCFIPNMFVRINWVNLVYNPHCVHKLFNVIKVWTKRINKIFIKIVRRRESIRKRLSYFRIFGRWYAIEPIYKTCTSLMDNVNHSNPR